MKDLRLGTRNLHLGSDCDAAFALEADGVEGALVRDVGAALPEKTVHESRLSVIDMSYNGHVTEVGGVRRVRNGRGGSWSGRKTAEKGERRGEMESTGFERGSVGDRGGLATCRKEGANERTRHFRGFLEKSRLRPQRHM